MCIYAIHNHISLHQYLLRYLSSKHPIHLVHPFLSVLIGAEAPSSSPMSDPLSSKVNPQNASNKKATMMPWLVGGFSPNPSEKYDRQNGFIFPKVRVENKKYLKPPPRMITPLTEMLHILVSDSDMVVASFLTTNWQLPGHLNDYFDS